MKVKDVALGARQIKAGPDDGLEDGQFTAYASVFGNEDAYGDVVVKGAFAADLKRWEDSGNPIPLLFGHNMTDPDFNLGSVVSAVEDEKGLLVTAQLDLDNPKAAQVYRMLKGRRINQMSFAYDVVDGGAVTHDEKSVYELRELKVYEVSVVTIGANQETEILAVKSATDALMSKAGRVLSAKNESALRSAHQQLVGAADEIKNVLSVFDDEAGKAAPAADPDASDAVITEMPTEEPEAAKGRSAETWLTFIEVETL